MLETGSSADADTVFNTVFRMLLEQRDPAGHWVGELSTSALSTATAVMAMELVGRQTPDPRLPPLVAGGLQWLAAHQNADGGWGDTVLSVSNISTTMLAHAVFVATKRASDFDRVVVAAEDYIRAAGGVEAVLRRYGDDHTFSVPILTHCALAGVVDWKHVIPLPFELAWIPARFYKTIRLPVVSYALPALIAIGQVIFRHRRPGNPFVRLLRSRAIQPTLRVLQGIQPPNGGFLEATPLTSFVTMSLAGCGLTDHPVVRKGVNFIVQSVRADGSWPIDTNLATWVTTLSVNAVGEHLEEGQRSPVREWLLNQQYRVLHPYTSAEPGGWSWTDLPGGVPDADDTPGAMLAILKLSAGAELTPREHDALELGTGWLLDLQNRDGGWPTFCRGWGRLPFDRSSADISAHVLRALAAAGGRIPSLATRRHASAIARGFDFLKKAQRDDGSWLPLWFGNQYADNEENPLYGTARVLTAFLESGRQEDQEAVRSGLKWVLRNQNEDGGWGGVCGTPSTVEETSLATECLLRGKIDPRACQRGLQWLANAVADGAIIEPAPIGFYFAKLWYFERLYPLIFAASSLNLARRATFAEWPDPSNAAGSPDTDSQVVPQQEP